MITAVNDATLDVDSARLFARLGSSGAFDETALVHTGGGIFEGTLPAAPCGETIEFYVAASTTDGEESTSPAGAPESVYEALAIYAEAPFDDDFETDLGWTVSGNATDGQWQRGIPAGGGDRGDPPADGDGSGRCYVTDNADGDSDVDNGSTILTSPVLDASGAGEAYISYHRWYSNNAGGAPESDIFVVDISNNGGASWVNLETVGPSGEEVRGGWFHKSFRIADVIAPTNQMRIRFNASDLGQGSVVEAGVDGVRIERRYCGGTNLTDVAVQQGSIISGGLSELLASDETHLRTRSAFGFTAFEPNVLDLRIGAATGVESPATIDLAVESRITARLRLINYASNVFDEVASYSIGTTESTFTVDDVPAADHVRASDGRLDLSIKHVVMATFSLAGFDSYFDLAAVDVQ
jgi:hypothetical protein